MFSCPSDKCKKALKESCKLLHIILKTLILVNPVNQIDRLKHDV